MDPIDSGNPSLRFHPPLGAGKILSMKINGNPWCVKITVVVMRFKSDRLSLLVTNSANGTGLCGLPNVIIDLSQDGTRQIEGHLNSLAPSEDLLGLLNLEFDYPTPSSQAQQTRVALLKPRASAVDLGADYRWCLMDDQMELNENDAAQLEAALARLRDETLLRHTGFKLLPQPFRMKQARKLCEQLWRRPIKPRRFKAWMMRRHALIRASPGRYTAQGEIRPDWLDPF